MSEKINYSASNVKYRITPMPVTDGPRYDHPDIKGIAYRKIGATRRLCYMVEVPEHLATFVPAYDKKLGDQELYANHCIVTSDKTGKPIVCDHKSCYGCQNAGRLDMYTHNKSSIEQMAEQNIEITTHDRTSDEAITKQQVQELLTDLKNKSKKLYSICQLLLRGYEADEIMECLNMAKSSYYDNLKRIRIIARKHI